MTRRDACLTCSDRADPVRVVALAAAGEARCVDASGRACTVQVELVPEAAPGDLLLVHAGVALARLAAEDGAEAP